MIQTVIVEDDPMVAQINSQYLTRLGGFHVEAVFQDGTEALDYLRRRPVDLVILDVHMPRMDGGEVLRRMRAKNILTPVIIVTAVTDTKVVGEALGLGIIDYLIKPYSYARFQEAVGKYLSKMDLMKSNATVDQSMVDRILSGESQPIYEGLSKGLNRSTLDTIYGYLQRRPGEQHTCESISAESGLSKVTVRRYLNYLIETGDVLSSIDYETGGRPRLLYQIKEPGRSV